MSARSKTLLTDFVSAHCFSAPSIPPKSLVSCQTARHDYAYVVHTCEATSVFAYPIWEFFFDKAVCLARLSDVDDDARDVGEFLHHRSPFFFVLPYFLFNMPSLTPETYKESNPKHTPRILSA
jgi:hypothetical protein